MPKSRILILGGDGYLGWPTAMHFAVQGHQVKVADDYSKRLLCNELSCQPMREMPTLPDRCAKFEELTGNTIEFSLTDCRGYYQLRPLIESFRPHTIIHYAEQPSAPYSMIGYKEAKRTMDNNLNTTLSLAHAVADVDPTIHIVKLGTMGEYGTPNIPIGEGWLTATDGDRSHTFMYPSEPGSLYHATKVADTHMLWLYSKTHNLRVTDIMQGPVYGLDTTETKMHPELATSFHYDPIFGTVINRFVAQAAIGHPLTIYGAGGQTRGFIHLQDVMQAIELVCKYPVEPGNMRIVNQVTELQSIRSLAQLVIGAAHLCKNPVDVDHIPNPREELEEHFFEVECHVLKDLGLEATPMTSVLLADMIRSVIKYKDGIVEEKILPQHSWRHSPTSITEDQLCPSKPDQKILNTASA